MRRLAAVLLVMSLIGCAQTSIFAKPVDDDARQYSADAITLSDFSMKIVAYYQSKNAVPPVDFDQDKFFELLQEIYPDQDRVRSIRDNYRVSVRPLDGGYSVMLCDPATDRKIMEDFSCHVNRVELKSWEDKVAPACAFEDNWRPYCGR